MFQLVKSLKMVNVYMEKCWYNHNNEELENENEDNAKMINKNGNETEDVIQRIMQMMETLTKRIMDIEIKNQKID